MAVRGKAALTLILIGVCLSGNLLEGCQSPQQMPYLSPYVPSSTDDWSETQESSTPFSTVNSTPEVTSELTPVVTPEATPTLEPTATPKPTPTPSPRPTPETILNHSIIYNSQTYAQDVETLCASYSEIISKEVIGKSYWGTNLYLLKVGKGPKKVLVTAGLHARENINTNFLMRCAEEYAIAYQKNTKIDNFQVRTILDEVTFYLVPLCNPDGVDIVNTLANPSGWTESTRKKVIWKANGRGVDLNRNFPYCWDEMNDSSDSPSYAGGADYPGKSAGSEPETQALMALCHQHEFQFCLNLHTKGKVFYWRDVGNGTISGDEKLVDILEDRTGYDKMSISSNVVGYGGGFENWFRFAFQRPAICIEMTNYDIYEGSYEKSLPYNLVNRADYGVDMHDLYGKSVLDWSKTRALLLHTVKEYFA